MLTARQIIEGTERDRRHAMFLAEQNLKEARKRTKQRDAHQKRLAAPFIRHALDGITQIQKLRTLPDFETLIRRAAPSAHNPGLTLFKRWDDSGKEVIVTLGLDEFILYSHVSLCNIGIPYVEHTSECVAISSFHKTYTTSVREALNGLAKHGQYSPDGVSYTPPLDLQCFIDCSTKQKLAQCLKAALTAS